MRQGHIKKVSVQIGLVFNIMCMFLYTFLKRLFEVETIHYPDCRHNTEHTKNAKSKMKNLAKPTRFWRENIELNYIICSRK